MWRRAPERICRLLSVILFAIGVGSFLFHTHAQVWAAIADVTPIALYIAVFVWAVHHHVLGQSVLISTLTVVLFFAYSTAATLGFQQLPFFEISAAYWPIAAAIFAYGIVLLKQAPQTARGFLIGALILTLSLTFRSIDEPLCSVIPMGTHLWWHILNGLMLGWMIEVLHRHLAGGGVGR